jgi:dienelactone hydrolase
MREPGRLCGSSPEPRRLRSERETSVVAWMARALFIVGLAVVVGTLGMGAAIARNAAATRSNMKLLVTPSSSLFDTPLTISVHGLKPKASATLRVTSTDVNGIEWSSEATFRADDSGTINPARTAPISGSYSGVQLMGLIDFMAPTTPEYTGQYFWGGDAPKSFTFTATSGDQRPAVVTVQRSESKVGVTQSGVTLDQAGFVGLLWQPAPSAAKRPALVVIGGSEGGLSGQLLGESLASQGYPTLNVAYFNLPGLPPTLSNIPLEYFAHALTWLGQQPNVDPKRIYTMGASRGSEAALLLGVHFPELVAGVIASVPGNAAVCSPTCDGPAWTRNGQPLPYTRQFNNTAPTDDPASVIAVEQIHGPILLVCGGSDQVWNSCPYASAIKGRLTANKAKRRPTMLSYPHAGHGVGQLVPYEPGYAKALNAPLVNATTGRTLNLGGATPDANAVALAKVWPRFLRFLRTS